MMIMLLRRPIMVKEPLWSSGNIIGWQVANTNYFLLFIFYLKNTDKMYIIIVVSIVITIRSGITNFSHLL